MLTLWIIFGIILFVICLRLGILSFFFELVLDLLGKDNDDSDSNNGGGFGGGSFGGGGSSDDV